MSREAYPELAPRAKPAAPRPGARPRSKGAEWTLTAAVAVLLLVPCFWQPRIIAGDLPSHVYNAWLAGQIEQGKIAGQGLSLAHPITNILADWALQGLLYTLGPSAAERMVAGAAVEIFFWGAFFFVAVAAGKRCWIIAPSLGMIAYGLIFHLGFLNFYLSTGFSLWVLALLWRLCRPWLWLAFPCSVLALLAHPLPLAWAVGALVYAHLLRRVPEGLRAAVFIAGVCLLILLQTTFLAEASANWSLSTLVGLDGFLGLTGAGQLWLYGVKYLIVIAGILIVWFILLLERLDRGSFLNDPVAHLWGLTMVAYFLLPALIQFPQYRFPLEFIQFRLSLFIAVLVCAMVAGGPHGRNLTRASSLLAAAFFTMVYLDAKAMNRVEAEVAQLVSTVPPGSRVITALGDTASPRLNGLIHEGAAACVGRCWDYGNYEPATGQFRVQAHSPNDVVVDSMGTVNQIESGVHIVTAKEAPLYSVCPAREGNQRFEIRRLAAGETTCLVLLPATSHF